MQVFRAMKGQQVWVRRVEHVVLRLVSLGFSLASAHAIRWFFAPLDGVDVLQPTITWMIAIGFGVLGYCVSRGLAHRLMNKERIRAYAPICLVVELVEIFCNYALAAAVVQRATWLYAVPYTQRAALTALTYVVLPLFHWSRCCWRWWIWTWNAPSSEGMAVGARLLERLLWALVRRPLLLGLLRWTRL